MELHPQRLAVVVMLALAGGCATTRTVTIATVPPDAIVKINGEEKGRGPITEQFTWKSAGQVHHVTATRLGYKVHTEQLARDDRRKMVVIELKPLTRDIHFTVQPAPAIIKIDGRQVTHKPVSVHTEREMEFTTDERNNWNSYTVIAERPGYQSARTTVSWLDRSPSYTLELKPLQKSLNITTNPDGAQIYLDNQPIGSSPIENAVAEFPVSAETDQFIPRELRAELPGYDPVEMSIAWDEGKSDYHLDFTVRERLVRIIPDPPDAKVVIPGVEPDRTGAMTVYTLQFAPINEQGELKIYRATIRKDPTEEREWEPAEITIAWDDNKSEYHVELKEIVTQPVPLLVAMPHRAETGWEIIPQLLTTLSWKDKTEGSGRPVPMQIARLSRTASIGSMAISPDGTRIVYTVLSGKERRVFRSQMMVVRTLGDNSSDFVSDGKSLDLHPAFTPGGDQILFSSNRGGPRMQIWSLSATGQPGVTRLTTSETHDLWPSMDSDPKPRLYYQALVDTRPDPRLYMTQIGTVFQTDMTVLSGMQPRVSPKNDSVLFTAIHDETGKRDIYMMSDRGGAPKNLTNTPDIDEYDPVWSRDGRMIAFASDRGLDPEGRRNYDIWLLDLSRPDEPIQITSNGSVDDNPLFDPAGRAIYFRSNRGGAWGIWKINLR